MKKILFFFLIKVVVVSASAQSLNVMTFNIRLNISSDGENAWPYRKDKAASQIVFHDVQILGVQEALHGQMMDLKEALRDFSYVVLGEMMGRHLGNILLFFTIPQD